MTASAKAERDIVQAKLGQSIRRLDGLTRENQIVVTLRNAQQLYDEALRQHIIFCNKKGEDPFAGAHLEWQNALEDNFGRSCIEAEEKLPELLASQCQQLLTRQESLLADVKIVGELEPYVEVLHAPVEGIVFAGLPPSVGCLVHIYTSRK